MYSKLPGNDDFRCFDLANEADSAVISKRVYGGFAKPPCGTLKHHLFNDSAPKKLFRAPRALCVKDKNGGFKKKRLLRCVAKIPISKNSK